MVKFTSLQRAALVQYLSLTLILLSVIVATAPGIRPRTRATVTLPLQVIEESPANEFESTIVLPALFDQETLVVESALLEPYMDLLDRHRLSLDIEIGTEGDEAEVTRNLLNTLEAVGFKRSEFTLTVSPLRPGLPKGAGHIRFRKERA